MEVAAPTDWVCPPACSRRQSGLREDNVLKLQCTHFSQCGQPVWEAWRALPPGASPDMPEFTVAAVMWERGQQEGGGLILLFILNRLSASLAVPFKNRQKQESGSHLTVYPKALEHHPLQQTDARWFVLTLPWIQPHASSSLFLWLFLARDLLARLYLFIHL